MIYVIIVLAILILLAVRKNYKLVTHIEELNDELAVMEDVYEEVVDENTDLEYMIMRMQERILTLEADRAVFQGKVKQSKKKVSKVVKKKSK